MDRQIKTLRAKISGKYYPKESIFKNMKRIVRIIAKWKKSIKKNIQSLVIEHTHNEPDSDYKRVLSIQFKDLRKEYKDLSKIQLELLEVLVSY
jgi:hypothetical protein